MILTSLISFPCADARRTLAYHSVSTVAARTSKVIVRPWSSCEVTIAAFAPACVAAPAGAIGNAAEAAEAQRKASASGNEAPTERALNSTKTASPRSAHEMEIRNQACEADLGQAV